MPVVRNLILMGCANEQEITIVCEAGKIDPNDLNNLEKRVPLENKIAVLHKRLELSQDKDLGLHLGENAELKAFRKAFKQWSGKTPAAYRSGIATLLTIFFPFSFLISQI